MTVCFRTFLLIVISFSGCSFTEAPPVTAFVPRVTQTGPTQTGSLVHTVQFESKMVGKVLPYNVVLPVNYNQPASRATRYPVLYLLHGLTGHYTDWTSRTKLSDYSAHYEIIIVTPEGNDGWYTDSLSVPSDKYETYIIKELIPDVARRYRTIETRDGRAIAGLSMGGYGALKFGVKYPEMFVFVGSMSGAPTVASWKQAEGFEFIRRSLQPTFGDDDSPTRVANDVPRLYRDLSAGQIAALPYIYLDCGTEDHLLQSNRSFADILVERKIPHEYRQLPGKHDWTYWDTQVQEVLKIAGKKMRTCNANC